MANRPENKKEKEGLNQKIMQWQNKWKQKEQENIKIRFIQAKRPLLINIAGLNPQPLVPNTNALQ